VIRRLLREVPRRRKRQHSVTLRFVPGLIVDRVEADDERKELVQLRVARWVDRHVKEGFEDVEKHVLEAADVAFGLIHLV